MHISVSLSLPLLPSFTVSFPRSVTLLLEFPHTQPTKHANHKYSWRECVRVCLWTSSVENITKLRVIARQRSHSCHNINRERERKTRAQLNTHTQFHWKANTGKWKKNRKEAAERMQQRNRAKTVKYVHKVCASNGMKPNQTKPKQNTVQHTNYNWWQNQFTRYNSSNGISPLVRLLLLIVLPFSFSRPLCAAILVYLN